MDDFTQWAYELHLDEILLYIFKLMNRSYNCMKSIYFVIGNHRYSVFNLSLAIFCVGKILSILFKPIMDDDDLYLDDWDSDDLDY